MRPKASTSANQAVQQEGRFLRQPIIFDEELLKLVDDQQDARTATVGMAVAVAGQIVDAGRAKQIAALPQFRVQTL